MSLVGTQTAQKMTEIRTLLHAYGLVHTVYVAAFATSLRWIAFKEESCHLLTVKMLTCHAESVCIACGCSAVSFTSMGCVREQYPPPNFCMCTVLNIWMPFFRWVVRW